MELCHPIPGIGYTTVNTVGSGISYPAGVAVDGSGNVFVADNGNNAVKEIVAVGGVVSSSSTVNTVGSGFSNPEGVAVDGSGNVFVADAGLNEVKEIDLSDPPSLSFASTEVGSTSSDSPQTVTIANSGNAPLTFPVPATGNNPSIAANFTLNSSGGTTCPLLTSTSSAGTLLSGSTCTLPISFTPTTFGTISGSLALTDTNLNASSSGYATQSIPLSGTATGATVTLTSSPNHSNVDDQVRLTAAVTGGSGTPTGYVTFKYNGTAISDCPLVPLDGTGTAECMTATLPAGTNSLTADYSGDLTYHGPKTSNTVTQTVNVSASTTMVSSTPDTRYDWTVDQPVTFTAIVAPSPNPYWSIVPFLQTGTVNFVDGYASITGCGAVHVSFNAAAGNASAQCTVTNFTPGSHHITAIFSGDSNYISSVSSDLGNTVDKAATTTTVGSSNASSTVNDSVTFTATVGPNPVPMLAIEVAISGSVLSTWMAPVPR
jgi:hypothetical protein